MSSSSRRRTRRIKGAIIAATSLLAVGGLALGVSVALPAPTPAPVSEKVASAYATGTALPTGVAASDVPIVAFLGDSYVEGSTQDDGEQFPDILAAQKNWDQVMLGEGGSGYVTKGKRGSMFGARMEKASGPRTDMVVVSGGFNDSDITALPQASRDTISRLRQAMPKIPIVVLSNFVPNGNPSERDLAKRDILADAAKRAGATFIDVTEVFVGHPDLIGTDGTHPTAAGHQHIAKVLAARLPAPRKG